MPTRNLNTPIKKEDGELEVYFDWVRIKEAQDPRYEYIGHIHHEGNRGKWGHIRAVAKGLRRGMPDVLCFIVTRKYNGMALEAKSETGRLSADQIKWLDRLEKQGWFTAVCRSFEEMKRATEMYLGR